VDYRDPQDFCHWYFDASSLKDISESDDNQNIVDFIKDAYYIFIINFSMCSSYFVVANWL